MSLFDVLADGTTTLDPKPELTYEGRAPLRFHVDHYRASELDAAAEYLADLRKSMPWQEWKARGGDRGAWIRASWLTDFEAAEHRLEQWHSDTRCDDREHRELFDYPLHCPCVGAMLTYGACVYCGWWAVGHEGQIAAWWHDHAMPGWRDLPIVPREIAKWASLGEKPAKKKLDAWVAEVQPEAWRFQGAPIITEREEHGMRSHPGSVLGGWDMSHTILDLPVWEPREKGVRTERAVPGVDYWRVFVDGLHRGDVRGEQGGGLALRAPSRHFDTRKEAVAWIAAGRPLPAGYCTELRDFHPFLRCDLADAHNGAHEFGGRS